MHRNIETRTKPEALANKYPPVEAVHQEGLRLSRVAWEFARFPSLPALLQESCIKLGQYF